MEINAKKGFTLVELLVVIAIIGLLAVAILIVFAGVREKARNAQRETNMNQVNKALQLYQNDHQVYPETLEYNDLEVLVPDCISRLPKDPKSADEYQYEYSSDGSTYTLTYYTEPDHDPQILSP